MASVTLAESAKLAQDELVAGVIENVITVNNMFELLPFDGIDGNALAYNRENVLGDVVLVSKTSGKSRRAPSTALANIANYVLGKGEIEVST